MIQRGLDYSKVGQRLREIRKDDLGLSMRQLSKKLGISSALWGFYERGKRRPAIDILYAFCTMFKINGEEISIDYIIFGDEGDD